jgi:hypothetical protein
MTTPDLGTPELRKHAKVSVANKRARVLQETPLDRYHDLEQITDEQHFAGMRFYRDWFYGVSNKSTLCLTESRGGDGKESDSRMEAKDAFRKASKAIKSLPVALLAMRVCCHAIGVKEAGRSVGFNTNYWEKLAEGLDQLDQHYFEMREKQRRELEACEEAR